MIALARLLRDRRGVTIVEFALVAPVLLLVLMATLELGYATYVSAMVRGAMTKAARQATIGNRTEAGVAASIKKEVGQIVGQQYVNVEAKSFYNFSNVGKAEKILQDTDPKGVYNKGDCYEDANNNGRYDSAIGATGLGTADDIVNYIVKVDYPNLTPLSGLAKWDARRQVTATIAIRNQPFTSRASATERCD